MKKTIILAAMLAVAAFDHAQDPSGWSKGDDVTTQLSWTDYECTNNDQGGWQTAGSNVDLWTSPCYELWASSVEVNGAGTEVYQVFYLPAGTYEFHVNAFYRHTGSGGSSVDITDVKGAEMFCLTGVSESGEAAQGSHEFKVKLADFSTSLTDARLFERTEEWWDNGDGEWTDSQGRVWYYPQCQAGCVLRFAQGYCDNALTIVQPADGYVRLGIRKLVTNQGNTIDWMGFRAIYQGEASEALELMLASKEFGEALAAAQAKLPRYADFGSLYMLYEDSLMDISDTYYGADYTDMTVQAYKDGIALVGQTEARFEAYLADARQLALLLNVARGVAASTSLPGLDAYQEALTAAANICTDKDLTYATTAQAYPAALHALQQARAAYAMSGEKRADGSWDFTTMVAYPFFVNMESNPTLSQDDGLWHFPEDVQRDQVKINADEFWFDTDASGWRHYGLEEHAGYYDARHWAAGWGEMQLVQDIHDLPNGYYSIAGLGMPGLRYMHANMWVQATSGDVTVKSAPVEGRAGFYEGGSTWDWATYATDLILVTDGHLRVAFADDSDNNLAFTGMQLFYYGEEPDFTLLVQPLIDNVRTEQLSLELQGDQRRVDDLLASIPETIAGNEAYLQAKATIAEALAYIYTARDYVATHDLTSLFSELADAYADDAQAQALLTTALDASFNVYDDPASTYETVAIMYADYQAYAHYLEAVHDYKAAAPSAPLEAKMQEQAATLAETYATAQTLTDMERELAAIANAEAFAQLDTEHASADNPIDLTAFIKNASFDEGGRHWTGNADMDGSVQASQAYNFSFDVWQTLYAMPAGTYQIRMKGLYRDGNLETAINHEWLGTDEGFVPNFEMYARVGGADEVTQPVVSIATEQAMFTDRTFTSYTVEEKNPMTEESQTLRRWTEVQTDYDADGNALSVEKFFREAFDADGLVITADDQDNSWVYDLPFDAGFETLYYPNSTRGAAIRFANDDDAYENVLTVVLTDVADLTIGARKAVTIEGDWCAFDNFRLYYVGAPSTDGITSVKAKAKAQVFGLDGTRRQHITRGVNVVVGADGQAHKVVVR